MIPTSSVFFFIFGSWRSYNSLQHAGIIFEKKKSKKKFSAKTILKKLLTLDSKKTLVASSLLAASSSSSTPIVINTWSFHLPCEYAWQVLNTTNDCVEAVVNGCSKCEELQCDGTVGYGGSPDETGETTLDAMIMDGKTHGAGCVAGLKRIKSAIKVAFSIMQYTSHTLLVGEAATQYAIQMGFKEESLKTLDSFKKWNDWIKNDCQPNFRRNVTPDPTKNCGPYKPISNAIYSDKKLNLNISNKSHDTIGMIAIDSNGNICAGTSTNGAQHKIPGRVGDSPLIGSGAYVDNKIGAACSTGDGDTLMKFLPSYQTVESIRNGMTPKEASEDALKRISQQYPNFKGAIIAIDKNGNHGAACHGFPIFHYCYRDSNCNDVKIKKILCSF